MSHSKLAAVLVAASMLLSTVASAQQHGRGEDQRQDDRRGGQEGGRRGGSDHHARPDRNQAPDGHGAGPDHAFQRGGRLPPEYRGHEYVVDDWRGHRLSRPPRGYHWVQSGGDYILVAITTGVILQLLLSH